MTLVIDDEKVEALCRDWRILESLIRHESAHLEQIDKELHSLVGHHKVACCGRYQIVRCNVGVVVLEREECA